MESAKARFDKTGIELAFPTRTVYMVNNEKDEMEESDVKKIAKSTEVEKEVLKTESITKIDSE